jgi:non-lysosomal glucosylceramidase
MPDSGDAARLQWLPSSVAISALKAEAHTMRTRPVLLHAFAVALAAMAMRAPAICAAEDPPPADAQPAGLVPADKGLTPEQLAAWRARGTQRVYRGDQRKTLGMPCGGVCAGQLYVLGDGQLGSWEIDGRSYFAGTGPTSYRTERPPQPVAQGFALGVRVGNGPVTRTELSDAGYDAIEFIGEYPRALIRYRAHEKQVPPVTVDLEVFSPFVPLDARASGWPATALQFTLRNTAAEPALVALGGWLENMVLRERASTVGSRRRNRLVAGDDVTTILMDAIAFEPPTPPSPQRRDIADFEGGTYDGWTVTGAAFGDAPASGTLPDQQAVTGFTGLKLVNSYVGGDGPQGRLTSAPFKLDLPYLTFRIGGGAHPGRTCLNLLVDGKVVRTATGRNLEQLEPRAWDLSDLTGRTAQLEIVDAESGAWGHVNVDDLVLTNQLGAEFLDFHTDALGYGNLALSVLGPATPALECGSPEWLVRSLLSNTAAVGGAALERANVPLIGGLTRELTLAPGETKTVTFLVSWYFPNLHTGQGRMYANWTSDARDVAVKLARELDTLHARTVRFCDMYYRATTLPWWLNTRLLMPISNLATGTAQWWKNGRFWCWEGAYCCEGTCTHVWNYAQGEAMLFPELVRSARTMQDLGAGFQETSGLVGFRSDRNFAADGQAGTVLKCYREHRTAADDAFLRQHWGRIRAALEYLISHDDDEDGVITNDRQHNTYDIAFVGANTFIGALYLAALRAGEEMARDVGDADSAQRYRAIYERGRAWIAGNLFNGEYYIQQIPAGDARPWQYGVGCLSDQLFGQNWAHFVDLGAVLPPEQVRSALAAVYKYNWAPDVGPLNKVYPPERWYARPGEPGLFICTWPRGVRPAEPVRYRDEVWTGIEYQVAAGLLWEAPEQPEFVDTALAIVHGIEQRYDGAKHNPWNEVECGDHYARALASWGVLHALAGFTFDRPAGRIALAPRIQQDQFECFFAAGTAWGTIGQRRTASSQTNFVQVVEGQFPLREFRTQPPAGVRVQAVRVTRGPQATSAPAATAGTPAEFEQTGGRIVVKLPADAEIGPGERVEMRVEG